jgi:hypothetical protein
MVQSVMGTQLRRCYFKAAVCILGLNSFLLVLQAISELSELECMQFM